MCRLIHDKLFASSGLLGKISVLVLELVEINICVFNLGCKIFLLLPLSIIDLILGSIWPLVITFAMFLAIFPRTHKLLSVRVVQGANTKAIIKFEFAFVDLTIGP